MSPDRLRQLLDDVRTGRVSLDDALGRLKALPFEDLGFARVDHHRALRTGHAEVIYGPGKTPEEIVAIARRIAASGDTLLITRLEVAAAANCAALLPDFDYDSRSRTARIGPALPVGPARGRILVVAAGTSDLPVAEEACRTLETLGHPFDRLYDVGVAGLHRLLAEHSRLAAAAVVIVIAGMEGALPSVVAGLVDRPVIAVPTSTGYGAALHGLTALLAMLSSCAAGFTVVNIDNGFGAAVAAARINRLEGDRG